VLELTENMCLIHGESDFDVVYSTDISETLYERDQAIMMKSINQDTHFIEFSSRDDLDLAWNQINQIKQKSFQSLLCSIGNLHQKALLSPTHENLEEIIEKLQEKDLTCYLSDKEIEEFISSLCNEFSNHSSPADFFPLFKLLINSCEEKVLKEFLSEEHYPVLLKVLQIDPELNEVRDYVSWFNESQFNNILDIKDEDFIGLVQLNFRIVFLKDHLLTKTFEERVAIVLNSFSCFINEEIIKKFTNSADIRAGLVIQLTKGNAKALHFIKALVGLGKMLFATNVKAVLFETFFEDEIFQLFFAFWEKNECRDVVIELIFEAFCVMPFNFKHFFMKRLGEKLFFEEFCDKGMDLEAEEVYSVAETLKLLFENYRDLDFPEVIDVFFDKVLQKFIEKLGKPLQSEASKYEIILIFAVLMQIQPNESKIDFVLSGVFLAVHELLKTSSPTLKVAIYKFYKIVIDKNDSHLISYFIKFKFLEQVFDDLLEGLAKETLIFSLTFGILLGISESSNKDLLIYSKDFSPRFSSTFLLKTFIKIEEKVQKIHEIPLLVNKNLTAFDSITNENFQSFDLSRPLKRTETFEDQPKKRKMN
jgi:hypothetical protein